MPRLLSIVESTRIPWQSRRPSAAFLVEGIRPKQLSTHRKQRLRKLVRLLSHQLVHLVHRPRLLLHHDQRPLQLVHVPRHHVLRRRQQNRQRPQNLRKWQFLRRH
ncbi:hypothetical protein ANCCAN_08465 [Ancylostoma caninum]|uniref:Uncharacterized protein n=1 Tax=Ancylostoma caninum TaxID=29170 RepID=A0A368GR94_ANCCA|nr:hypothetical protein ANCCAN_08465 [Ancylostoma caninum]